MKIPRSLTVSLSKISGHFCQIWEYVSSGLQSIIMYLDSV